MTHLRYLKHKLWPKERSGVKLPIWLLTTKSQESPWFTYVQVACHISLESSRWRLQFFFGPHLNQRFTKEVIGLQSCKSPNFENFGTPNLRILGWNDIWMQALWLGTKNIIRGKWWLPPNLGHGGSLESVFARGLFVHQKCFNYTLTNLLFGLCRSMWLIDLLVIRPNPHPKALARPSTPKMLRAKEHIPTLYPCIVFSFGLILEFIKEFGGASL